MKTFVVSGKVFKYPGVGGWHFLELGDKQSTEIKNLKTKKIGWGFIKVRASIGKVEWDTTLFPTKEGPFLLSLKADVRRKAGVYEGDEVKARCSLL